MKPLIPVFLCLSIVLPGYGQQSKSKSKPAPGFVTPAPKKEEPKKEEPSLFTIDGKIKHSGQEPRDFVIGEVVSFEKPNLQSKWNPDPITAADVGWSYLVHRVWDNGEIVVQPRFINKDGVAHLGRAFVIKGHAKVKPKSLVPMEGLFRLVNTTENPKNRGLFFVFEVVK
jgi:hypothetical protein